MNNTKSLINASNIFVIFRNPYVNGEIKRFFRYSLSFAYNSNRLKRNPLVNKFNTIVLVTSHTHAKSFSLMFAWHLVILSITVDWREIYETEYIMYINIIIDVFIARNFYKFIIHIGIDLRSKYQKVYERLLLSN